MTFGFSGSSTGSVQFSRCGVILLFYAWVANKRGLPVGSFLSFECVSVLCPTPAWVSWNFTRGFVFLGGRARYRVVSLSMITLRGIPPKM